MCAHSFRVGLIMNFTEAVAPKRNHPDNVRAVLDAADEWLTLQQCAREAKLHERTLRRACHAGQLRFARVLNRKSIRIRRRWLSDFLEASATPIEVTHR